MFQTIFLFHQVLNHRLIGIVYIRTGTIAKVNFVMANFRVYVSHRNVCLKVFLFGSKIQFSCVAIKTFSSLSRVISAISKIAIYLCSAFMVNSVIKMKETASANIHLLIECFKLQMTFGIQRFTIFFIWRPFAFTTFTDFQRNIPPQFFQKS